MVAKGRQWLSAPCIDFPHSNAAVAVAVAAAVAVAVAESVPTQLCPA
jgi:hypothetical protein